MPAVMAATKARQIAEVSLWESFPDDFIGVCRWREVAPLHRIESLSARAYRTIIAFQAANAHGLGELGGIALSIMIRPEVIGLALEAAIAVQLVVLTASLLSRSRKSKPALWLLTGITGSIGFMMLTNGLMRGGAWHPLLDVNLFVELLLPPAIYLYVSQFRRPPRPLTWVDTAHALPAILGVLLWETGFVHSMDLYVIACWVGYVASAFIVVWRSPQDSVPASLRPFLATFLGIVSLIGAFRIAVAFDLPQAGSFREGVPYLLLLAVLLLTTCQLLFTALKRPDLFGSSGVPLKYELSGANEFDLAELSDRFDRLLQSERPYLDSDLSVSQLAARLDAPDRHVSQLINTRFGMNFPAYMNYCRVQLASEKLNAEKFAHSAIKTIMYESGFKSKSIFNREFQRHFGVSPSEYRHRQSSPDHRQSG